MRKFSIPLFWKFTIAIISIVAIFGTINTLFVKNSISKSLVTEFEQRGLFIARSIADRSASYLLLDDLVSLHKLIVEQKSVDSSIYYIFVLNGNNEVIAQTFENDIGMDLVFANTLEINQTESLRTIKTKSAQPSIILDLAIPIIDQKVGTVRVGLIEDTISKDIRNAVKRMLLMIAIFLIAGIFGAFLFSYVITTPIRFLSRISDQIDLDSIRTFAEKGIQIRKRSFLRLHRFFQSNDEIDILYDKFIQMIGRLEKAHKELQIAQVSLMHSEKLAAIGTLTAGLAHELNNPVAGIQHCLKRILKSPDNVVQNKQYLLMMEEATQKIVTELQSLLNYSRKQDMKFKDVDIYSVIESALLLVEYKLDNFTIAVSKEYIIHKPLIRGSSSHLEQVLLNLFLNSIDAINERQITDDEFNNEIIIRVYEDNDMLICDITDNGLGIQVDKIKNVFDPFFTTKKVGEGTGLGLSICYMIIQEHKGNLSVKSKRGETTFTLSLPLKNEQ